MTLTKGFSISKIAAAVFVGLFLIGSMAEDASAVSKRKPSTKKTTQKKPIQKRTTAPEKMATTTTALDPTLWEYEAPPFPCTVEHDLDGDRSTDCMNVERSELRYWVSRTRRKASINIFSGTHPDQYRDQFKFAVLDPKTLTIWFSVSGTSSNDPDPVFEYWLVPVSFREGRFRGWGASGEPVRLFSYSTRPSRFEGPTVSYSCGSRSGLYLRHTTKASDAGTKIVTESFAVGPDNPLTELGLVRPEEVDFRTDCSPLDILDLPRPAFLSGPVSK